MLDVIVFALLFGGNHILVYILFAQNMHKKLFFQAPNAKFSLLWEGEPLPTLGRFAPSQCSSKDRSLGFSTPPPPEKFLVTGLYLKYQQNLKEIAVLAMPCENVKIF